jgi:hypothetical protein
MFSITLRRRDLPENTGPGADFTDHRTGVVFPDVVVTPLHYVD